jgi:hypothetical protein
MTVADVTSDPSEKRAPERYSDADYPLQPLTGRIISAFHFVHYTHGFGFLEALSRRALAIELRHRGVAPVAKHLRPRENDSTRL